MKHSAMLSSTDLRLFCDNVTKFLGSKLPATEVTNFVFSHSNKVTSCLEELSLAISSYNKFRCDSHFPNREFYINANNLDKIYNHDLPELTDIFKKLKEETNLSDSVYANLGSSNYFQEVWQVRPIKHLVVNLFLLVYRTGILQSHKAIMVGEFGNQKVQISSTIEEMIYYQYLLGNAKKVFPALKMWLEDWQGEGFSQRLHDAIFNRNEIASSPDSYRDPRNDVEICNREILD